MSAHEIETTWIQFETDDGLAPRGYLARPVGEGKFPALLVLQEIFGINPHVRELCERFAREGYVALAPELFHRRHPGFVGSYEEIPQAIQIAMQAQPDELIRDMQAAVAYLRGRADVSPQQVGAIGYCMGGRMAWLINAHAELAVAVSYYGGLIAQTALDLADKQHAPLLLVWAGIDPYIPVESERAVEDALKAAGKSFASFHFSKANHGFFCDARSDYHPEAAAQVWPLTLAYLQTYMQQAQGQQA